MKSAPVVTPPEEDFYVRARTAYDLEKTLVILIANILDAQRLDNPTLNLAQPDVVPFDYTDRAQTLEEKVAPRVVRGRVPRTVTGEIQVDQLPNCPAIIVQAINARVEQEETIVTAKILVNAYDENPDGGGYQDVLNLTETISLVLSSFGQGALDQSYPIVLPLEWRLIEADTFPHFLAEITTHWELPTGRPLPDRGLNDPWLGLTAPAPGAPWR